MKQTIVLAVCVLASAATRATAAEAEVIFADGFEGPVDLASPVASSSDDGTPLTACLVAGSSARVLVWTDLRHISGSPARGAGVEIGGVAATPSTARPGTYWREVAAADVPGLTSLPVVATTFAGTVVLSSSVSVTHLPAHTSSGGTGGCSPTDGNLRVRVVEAETGNALAGAGVMVGPSEATPFEHNPEALFGGPSSRAANVAATDALGYATFYDYGSNLAGAVTTTAGAENRAYFTVAEASASDLVLALPKLHAPPVPATVYGNTASSGGVNPWLPTGCDAVDFGIVLPKLSLDQFSSFRAESLFGRNRCWNTNNALVGTLSLAENMWMPAQTIGPLCLGGALSEAPWSLPLPDTAATGVTENVQMVMGSAPYADVQQGPSAGEMLRAMAYRRIGFLLDETVPTAPTATRSVVMNETYANSYTVTFGGTPAQTDVVGVTGADYSGGNGTGSLLLLGISVKDWNVAGASVAIPNSDLNAAGAPVGERRLASVTALYLDPDGPGRPPLPANHRDASTTVLIRDDGSGGAPFGTAGGAGVVTDFLGLAGTMFAEPDTFLWEDASANGNAPLYSVHELTVRKRSHLPVLSCQTTNEVREEFTTQWVVVRPFAPTCAAQECFTLPALPPAFPRAASGPQQRSGFEQRVGSGGPCGGPGDCIAGEACVDPDGTGSRPQMCMSGSGTDDDPYAVEDYVWKLHVYDLELAPEFDFDAFEFARRRDGLTHQSSNTHVFN